MSYRNISFCGDRTPVINYLKEQKQKGEFKVIDVGASQNPWSIDIIDAIIDFNPPNLNNNIKRYNFDITDYESWADIEKEVQRNGKYDFSICSHTLEDIIDPRMVVKKLQKISKAGFISIPSKYKEFAREVEFFENNSSPYRGYIHHRWIFTFLEGAFIAFPKINFIEYLTQGDKLVNSNYPDLNFYWENEIELKYINNNYLGPSISAVKSYYDKLMFDDCDKIIKNL